MVKKIRLPEDAPLFGSLKAGDRVLLSGVVYTARDAAHRRLTEMMKLYIFVFMKKMVL